MAYSTNPYLPKARAAAMRLLVVDQQPISMVALRAGVHRSTVWPTDIRPVSVSRPDNGQPS